MTAPSAPRRRPRWWGDLTAVLPPLGVYGASLVGSLVVFTVAVLVLETNDAKDFAVLSSIWLASLFGTGVGQLAALLRIRTEWVALFAALLFGLVCVALYFEAEFETLATGLLGEAGPPVIGLGLLLGAYFVLCGLWSLRVHTGVLAAWGPVLFVTAAILVISDNTDQVEEWYAGRKWAIWDFCTAPLLLAGVAFLVLFLVTKERHRLHHWATSDYGPDGAISRRVRGGFDPIAGCGTVAMFCVLATVLTVDSGVVAPYLWRTGPGDDDGSGTIEEPLPPEPEPAPEPVMEPPPEPSVFPQPPDLPELDQAMRDAAEAAGKALCMLMTLVILALGALVVFGPPLRRTLLLQHLRRPLWPVGPTRTVQQRWRTVEIALADAGVPRKPGESSLSLAHRAAGRLALPDPEPLLVAARLTDRVVYGFGMDKDDVSLAERCADMAYQSIYELLSEGAKLKAQYRWL